MPRRTLKNRRPNSSVTVEWEEQTFELTVGFYDDGQIGEIFAGGGKTPQAVQQLVADACVLISIALQYGVSITALGKSLARHEDGKPYTIIGIICDVITTYEEKEPGRPCLRCNAPALVSQEGCDVCQACGFSSCD